jgi:secreted trypsin-like serine protease
MTLVSGAAGLAIVSGAAAAAEPVRSKPLSAAAVRQLRSLYRAVRHHPRARAAIIGGQRVQQGYIPYAAFVVDFDIAGNPRSACSGTLIAANIVLTAAHCLVDENTDEALDPSGFRVVTGALDWTDGTGEISHVDQVIPNPSYDPYSDQADAGLLVLHEPSGEPTIRLAASNERYLYTPGIPAVVAGWGVDDTGNPSDVLRWADTSVQGAGYCSANNDLFDVGWQTCAVEPPGFATGACSGDSGGPLLTLDLNNQPVQIGVIDQVPQDCNTNGPDFFARTNPLFGWVNAQAAMVGASIGQPPARPAPPTLTEADERYYARAMIRQRTHRTARPRLDCGRISPWKVGCDISWSTATADYTASGTFWHFLQARDRVLVL